MSELLLPAGDLNRALISYENGADAVYFGLKKFSARKGAENFSIEDVSKIKEYALRNNKKFYIALNTILNDNEIDEVLSMLDEIAPYSPDGIIIQDLGLFHILKKYYPSIPLHASTQLAIHTLDGVKIARDLGFKRVVLSRELSLKEIEKIRTECRDIELEVFIHGSLCYGFSGLCFASYLKCGRSANKGECAQICRSWSTLNNGKRGYFFSMKDLFSKEDVLLLRDNGIDSLKIEGRLKSPEYSASCAKYYRYLLDNNEINKEYEDDVITSFLRSPSSGYLHYKDNEALCSPEYPGHMGLKSGKIVDVSNTRIKINNTKNIDSHDGLQYFVDNNGVKESVKFSCNLLEKDESYITIKQRGNKEDIGKDIYKISNSNKRVKTYSFDIPHFKIPVDISITLNDNLIRIEGDNIYKENEIKIDESKNENDFKTILESLFKESGSSKYILKNLTFTNNSKYKSPFIPPSVLKSLRRDFYTLLDSKEIKRTKVVETKEMFKSIELPERSLLDDGELPYNLKGIKLHGRTYFTLPPIMFDEEDIYKELENNLRGKQTITIGINNISQIEYAKNHREFDYFIDVFLYLGNRFSAEELLSAIPSLIGGYLFVENKDYEDEWPFRPTIANYTPPLFISRTCFKKDSLNGSCKNCTKNMSYSLNNNKDNLSVTVKNCITYVRSIP